MANIKDLKLQWKTDFVVSAPMTITLSQDSIRTLKLFHVPDDLKFNITKLGNLRHLVIMTWTLTDEFFNNLPPTLQTLHLTSCNIDTPFILLPPRLVKFTLISDIGMFIIPEILNTARLRFLSDVEIKTSMSTNTSYNGFIIERMQAFIDSLPPTLVTFNLLLFPPTSLPRNYSPGFDILNFSRLDSLREFSFNSLQKKVDRYDLSKLPPFIEKLELDVLATSFVNNFPLTLNNLRLDLTAYKRCIDVFWKEHVYPLDLKTFTAKQPMSV
ncbi:unnamed protein product [Ambrosiozyma monospora]|uniref:Unnamed protein product n=1 Tax=Ambrosiozyma monospora TaxID=43982 RepID=A0ACB5TTV6_AMBMO|nr:unnamed protein product [Ambrosiozyma monospora]